MNTEQAVLLPVEEAARLLGIGKTLAWSLIERKQISVVRLGKRVLVPRHEIERIAGSAAKG